LDLPLSFLACMLLVGNSLAFLQVCFPYYVQFSFYLLIYAFCLLVLACNIQLCFLHILFQFYNGLSLHLHITTLNSIFSASGYTIFLTPCLHSSSGARCSTCLMRLHYGSLWHVFTGPAFRSSYDVFALWFLYECPFCSL
jgi:hypothetical protein